MSDNDVTSSSAARTDPQGPPSEESEDRKAAERDNSAKGVLKLVEELQQVKLFHTPGREPFVSFWVKDHWENCRVKSATFKDWLSAMCYHRAGFVPTQKTIAEATSTLAGHALYASPEEQVFVRLAKRNGEIYVDLGNNSWQAVRITGQGWEIVSHLPIKFARAPGMLALPCPTHGGSVGGLSRFVNLHDEDYWRMAVSWLVGALSPTGPFPILVLEGTHGSAKSTCSRLLLSLVDPNRAQLRAEPRNPRDLAISAGNSWCLGFDNLSSVRPWLSDALCRLSTGSGFSTRTLYTDDDEKIFEGMRPVLLNGIEIGIDREDLLDRAIILSLQPIPEERRETEASFWAQFEAFRPSILGSLFDAVACALRRLPEVNLPKIPRMADFATWVCAAEPALGWPEGAFLEAYRHNRQDANSLALEASSLVQPIMRLLDRGPWEGTATELRGELMGMLLVEIPVEEVRPLPETAKELSQALRRLLPCLLQVGVRVDFGRTPGDNSKRIISIRKSGDAATQGLSDALVKG